MPRNEGDDQNKNSEGENVTTEQKGGTESETRSEEITGPLMLPPAIPEKDVADVSSLSMTSCTVKDDDVIGSFAVDWDSFRCVEQCSCGKPIDALSRKVNHLVVFLFSKLHVYFRNLSL